MGILTGFAIIAGIKSLGAALLMLQLHRTMRRHKDELEELTVANSSTEWSYSDARLAQHLQRTISTYLAERRGHAMQAWLLMVLALAAVIAQAALSANQ